jgi:hypothetical protein
MDEDEGQGSETDEDMAGDSPTPSPVKGLPRRSGLERARTEGSVFARGHGKQLSFNEKF